MKKNMFILGILLIMLIGILLMFLISNKEKTPLFLMNRKIPINKITSKKKLLSEEFTKKQLIPKNTKYFVFKRFIYYKSESYMYEIVCKNSQAQLAVFSMKYPQDKLWKLEKKRKLSKNEITILINILNYIDFMGLDDRIHNKHFTSRELHEQHLFVLYFVDDKCHHTKSINVFGLNSGFIQQDVIFKILYINHYLNNIAIYKENGKIIYWNSHQRSL